MNHLGDTNKMVRDTPRMDASAHDDGAIWETGCEIERELIAANIEIEEKRKDVVYLATEKAKLEERIKRLEEAGNKMDETADPFVLYAIEENIDEGPIPMSEVSEQYEITYDNPPTAGDHVAIERARKDWRKAKEDKL